MATISELLLDFQSWFEMFIAAPTESDAEFCKFLALDAHKKFRAEVQRLQRTASYAKIGKTFQGLPVERIAGAKTVPIEYVVQKYGGVILDKHGRGNCPFHGSSNATTLHRLPRGNAVCCFICDPDPGKEYKTWNPIDAVMALEGKSFREAVEALT